MARQSQKPPEESCLEIGILVGHVLLTHSRRAHLPATTPEPKVCQHRWLLELDDRSSQLSHYLKLTLDRASTDTSMIIREDKIPPTFCTPRGVPTKNPVKHYQGLGLMHGHCACTQFTTLESQGLPHVGRPVRSRRPPSQHWGFLPRRRARAQVRMRLRLPPHRYALRLCACRSFIDVAHNYVET